MRANKRAIALALSASAAIAATGFVATASAHQAEDRFDITDIPAGTYELDPAHGKITWSVAHLGFSTYKGQFPAVSATLSLDREQNIANVFWYPLVTALAGFGFLFLALVLYRTRTEIRARRLKALIAQERMA